MEQRDQATPAQDQTTPNQPTQTPEKKRRFKLVRLEERIAPAGSTTHNMICGSGIKVCAA